MPIYSSLKGKTAIVTGGGSGIGKAICLALASQEVRVVVANRREALGQETADTIQANGGKAMFVKTDIAEPISVRNLIQQTIDSFGTLDLAINNAAGIGDMALLAEQNEESFSRLIDVNIKGSFYCLKYELEAILSEGLEGAIVNILSIHALRTVVPGLSPYTATKHAVHALTKAAAVEYAEQGIRINSVAPGPTDTEMLREAAGGDTSPFTAMLPMQRLGTPEEVADAVLWLCSDNARFVTGQLLAVDGGYLAK
ncbi:2,5-dichloro-2,5-cyclohexadiene-1,4-diol dehydrogenase [Hyella patelloides LEGE 07179]|uniref:2,5-dichloro-2,5-cyclohexadiene-1,4-diol dehydrogenase n=1 Tax=Hyella patelloides LEGE 07179 TaxID=945734 RepID=A0A563W570_9CYAN|nr:glucose 1-dehydrogenase [Hyella patelloides]VEP18824.1 2,5-dichloro-2,5-cyclohexadiene-1,4-diol dehydrogenase [Hyella patelloides LEGE 07179]